MSRIDAQAIDPLDRLMSNGVVGWDIETNGYSDSCIVGVKLLLEDGTVLHFASNCDSEEHSHWLSCGASETPEVGDSRRSYEPSIIAANTAKRYEGRGTRFSLTPEARARMKKLNPSYKPGKSVKPVADALRSWRETIAKVYRDFDRTMAEHEAARAAQAQKNKDRAGKIP